MSAADIRWAIVFADVPAADLDRELAFWQDVSGARPGEPTGDSGQFVPLRPDEGEAVLWLQRLDDGPARWHLDLYPADVDTAVAGATGSGAHVVREDKWFVALSSPAGQPFCLVRGATDPAVPPARTWPDGHRSEVDQLCLDIPATVFDAEADFWAALTGWPRRAGDLPEFDHLARPPEQALRILLQRLGPDDGGGMRAHLDVASDDRDAETARHEAAGATVAVRAPHWTVLRDPVGLVYCITDRTPRG